MSGAPVVQGPATRQPKVLLFANTDWYLYNFRRNLARALRESGWEVVLVSPPGRYGGALAEAGFRWRPLRLASGGLHPAGDLMALGRIVRLYLRERPDLVHHFTVKCVLYGTVGARLAGVRGVVNAVTGMGHVFTDRGPRARLLRAGLLPLYRWCLRQPRVRVVVQNEADQDELLAMRAVDPRSTRVIRGSGVDCVRFRPPTEAAARPVPRVLFASRLLWEKGVGEFVAAARALRDAGVAAEFVCAGDYYPDNPSGLTNAEVAELAADGAVAFIGQVDDMPRLIGGSDLVVLPSYREGTPKILLEAAAMGRAIVATDIPGCRGVVEDGVNGLLVPLRDAGSLAAAVRQLLEDAPRRAAMGRAGREIVERLFDEHRVLEETLALYEELTA